MKRNGKGLKQVTDYFHYLLVMITYVHMYVCIYVHTCMYIHNTYIRTFNKWCSGASTLTD